MKKLLLVLLAGGVLEVWLAGCGGAGGRCGDAVVQGGEGCDDGNLQGGDGCTADCHVEPDYVCLASPSICTRPTVCGNGVREEDEECDDGGTVSGDGCSLECLQERGYFCAGTPSQCYRLENCGDGALQGQVESCDDGNVENGDGCSSLCQVEAGFACTGSPSDCVLVGTVYFVRTDGGDGTQCDGRRDAPYPGAGQGQNCAWSHPFYALDQSGQWKLSGGDALVIGPGSYRMGVGAPGSEAWCFSEYPWDCHLPPLPSGPDAAHPTRLLGAGYATGCAEKPELWGTERAYHILDLSGTSHVVVDCLEITDHSGCALSHCNAGVACPRGEIGPFGDYADEGIVAADGEDVILRRLDVHGLAAGGIHAARMRNFTLEQVRIAGNGLVGFDGDLGEDSSNRGLIRFRAVTVEWNGCPEDWPSGESRRCWGQNVCGGYGDGVGVARSGGRWLIEGCLFRYNTSDGLDLLYVGVNRPFAQVEVRETVAYGNAGNQLKVGGRSRIVNSVAVGNCAYFRNQPFAPDMGDFADGDLCRAGGAAVSVNLPRGRDSFMVNCTLASEGWAVVEAQCNNLDFPDQPTCDGSERLHLLNNVVRGYQVVWREDERATDLVGDGDPYHFTRPETVSHNLLWNLTVASPLGEANSQQEPRLQAEADIDAFDGHPRADSPALDAGLPVGDFVPAYDLEGNRRPSGAAVDLGAYERR